MEYQQEVTVQGVLLLSLCLPAICLMYFALCYVLIIVVCFSIYSFCVCFLGLYRVTYTRCRIDIIDSPDDEHLTARNM